MLQNYEKIKDLLKSNRVIIISAKCDINYDGRAATFLPEGDRFIIIKPDKNLLVHQPTGTTPINYMKQGSEHNVYFEKKQLYIKSKNLTLKEEMIINLNKIYSISAQFLNDGEKLQLQGSEKDMAQKIYDQPELIEEGFKPLNLEEHTKYGFIDVFGYDKDNTLVIVECKRQTADLAAVTQLRRYVEKITSSKGIKKARGILAAPSISDNAKKMLEDWKYEYKQVEPPKYQQAFNKKQKKLGEF